MAANDREITAAAAASSSAASVQTSKLSPHVKPFVPRHLQQTEPSSYLAPRSSHPSRYSPNYHVQHGYPNHQAHYFPLMSGPYSLQDFQTGYSLYPYPVFMVEEVTPHGSYVSPGTFVCPRASLQPRRTSTKSRFNDHSSNSKGGSVSDGVQTQSSSNKSSSSTASSETSDESSVRNAKMTNGETKCSREEKKLEEVSSVEKSKWNDRQTNWKQRKLRQTSEKRTSSSNEGVDDEEHEGKEEKISNGNSRSSSRDRRHHQVNRETHFPKPKSFAEIIKQNSSDNIVVDTRNNSCSVSICSKTDEEKVNVSSPSPPPPHPSCEKNGEQKSISKNICRENGTTSVGNNDSQRWSYVQSKRHHHQYPQSEQNTRNRSSRRSSTSSDANSVHYEKPVQGSFSIRNGKEFETFNTSITRKHEDSIRSRNQDSIRSRNQDSIRSRNQDSIRSRNQDSIRSRNQDSLPVRSEDSIRVKNESRSEIINEVPVKIDAASTDDDAWTEVKSNRRWKDSKQQSRRQVHFAKKTADEYEVVKTNRNSKESSPLAPPPPSSLSLSSSSSSQQTDKKSNCLETASRIKTSPSTLCNSKTLKNTENQLEKSRNESKTNNSESLTSENEVKTKKKKRKTAGQLKKEFHEKVKTLPAVQGKVLTVSEEFYNQFKQNATDNSTVNVLNEKRLSRNEFPRLKKKNQVVNNLNCEADIAATMNLLNVDSDDGWTDVEGNESYENYHKDLDKKKNSRSNCIVDSFPALGSLIDPFVASDMSYSSLLKKNFWSLPPRITPVENVSMDNRTSFLEKLLAESSQKDCPVFNGQMKGIGGLITFPDGHLNATDSVPIQKIEPKKKPKSNSVVKIHLINLIKKKQKRSKIRLSSKYAKKNPRKVIPYIANILDSTAPLRRRGKEREHPRKKKPSALKKIILKEREAKRSIRASKVVINDEEEKENGEEVVESTQDDDAKESCAFPSASGSENVTAKHIIHSRKFREYCDQMLNPEIDEVAKNLIHDLIRFHDRLYNKNPIKASLKRRMVIGLREVGKNLKQKKLKCLILAPNLERIKSSGGLDEAMYSVIGMAQEQNVPFVFALGRRRLGRVCLKKVPVSCVGIFNYSGSESNFNRLCELAEEARKSYQNTLSEVLNDFESCKGISNDVEGL